MALFDCRVAQQLIDHPLVAAEPGFNFNVGEWDARGQTYETLVICRSLELARAVLWLRSRRSPPAGS